jgi:hypothetical protein
MVATTAYFCRRPLLLRRSEPVLRNEGTVGFCRDVPVERLIRGRPGDAPPARSYNGLPSWGMVAGLEMLIVGGAIKEARLS